MAYKRRKNRRLNAGKDSPLSIDRGVQTVNDSNVRGPSEEFFQVEPAEVVDIILNDTHDLYDSEIEDPSEQIGMIKVRRVFSDQDVADEERLPFAVPIDTHIKHYPIKHEIVLVTNYINKGAVESPEAEILYYSNIINMWGSVHHNALPFVSVPKPNADESMDKDLIEKYKEVGFGNPNKTGDEDGLEFGKTFKEQAKIRPIQPYEGDITFEGRFGQSIRFGSAVKGEPANVWSDPSTDDPAEPILIIRNGQDQDLEDGGEHVIETPDLEASTIWMTRGQTVPLTFGSTKYDALSFEAGTNTVGEDLTAPTTDDLIDGEGERQGQILLTSNRLVLNSREAGTYIFGGGGIGLTTETDLTLDAGSELLVDTPSVYLNATEKFELECPLIYLGVEQDSAEGGAPTVGSTSGHPLVMGDVDDSWKARFCDIVDAMLTTLQSEIHPTPCGPSGPPVQAPQYGTQQSDLAALKADIPTQYSQTVFVQP
jgi:hypothetical protein